MPRSSQDRLARKCYENAITDDEVRAAVHRRDPKSLDQAIEEAQKEEAYLESERIRKGLKPKQRDHHIAAVTDDSQRDELLKMMKEFQQGIQKGMQEGLKEIAGAVKASKEKREPFICRK
ncbi:unnamed protein product, partial [Owenia fusiformis]